MEAHQKQCMSQASPPWQRQTSYNPWQGFERRLSLQTLLGRRLNVHKMRVLAAAPAACRQCSLPTCIQGPPVHCALPQGARTTAHWARPNHRALDPAALCCCAVASSSQFDAA